MRSRTRFSRTEGVPRNSPSIRFELLMHSDKMPFCDTSVKEELSEPHSRR
jgi:hypothetical protein